MINYSKLQQLFLAKRAGQTNKTVAPAIGVSESVLSRFLDGQTLSLESYGRLCDWLGCSLDEFWGGREDNIDQRMRRVMAELDKHVDTDRPLDALCHALLKEFGEH